MTKHVDDVVAEALLADALKRLRAGEIAIVGVGKATTNDAVELTLRWVFTKPDDGAAEPRPPEDASRCPHCDGPLVVSAEEGGKLAICARHGKVR